MFAARTRRREFLRCAATLAAAPHVINSAALGSQGNEPASERVTLGLVGCGNRGSQLAHSFGTQVLAVCDPFTSRRETVARRVGGRAFSDFRELLDLEYIDAVVIATPDHWHVPIAIAAARAGKDIFCEKPLGVCLAWDMELRRVVQRYGRVFQYGTQSRSWSGPRKACELVRNGHLGELREIRVLFSGAASKRSLPPVPVPKDLDYDMWLGPAPRAPYHRQTEAGWVTEYDYSINLGWIGSHVVDIAVWGFDAHMVGNWEIEGTGEIPKGPYPKALTSWDVRIRFANGVSMTLKKDLSRSVRFIGTKGWVQADNLGWQGRTSPLQAEPLSLLDPSAARDQTRPSEAGLRSREFIQKEVRHHGLNFIKAIKTRGQTVAPVEDAVRSETILHLANIAIRCGRRITWNPEKETIVDDDEASRMLRRPMREPWRL